MGLFGDLDEWGFSSLSSSDKLRISAEKIKTLLTHLLRLIKNLFSPICC